MYKLGFWLMAIAFWLAVLGIFFSDPSGQTPEKMNLFQIAMHLEVQMFRTSGDPPRYLVNVLAKYWLLGCIVVFVIGAVLSAMARARRHA